jgi:signal transduction histidine kinase
MKTLLSRVAGETEQPQSGALTDHTLAAVRLILAAGGSIMIYVATEPERYVSATYYSLLAYTTYSFILYLVARRRINFSPRGVLIVLWTDVACYTVLTSLNSGTNNLFSFFYLFAIIVASSRCGTRMGLWVTAVSALLFITVGLAVTTRTPLENNRFLLRRSAMVAIGYILAYWGGAELSLKRRMALLNDLSQVANPRFGVQRTIEQMLQRLRAFYQADYCILLMKAADGLELYRTAGAGPGGGGCHLVRLAGEEQIPQIDVSRAYSGVFTSRRMPWSRQASFKGQPDNVAEVVDLPREEGRTIADFLGAESFVTVPLLYRDQLLGRLLVSSKRRNAFDIGDAAFLRQVAAQVLPVIENIRLVDRMASDASEEERRRIARSVHDRVIQPYFGLQIGLKALHGMLEERSSAPQTDLRDAPARTPIALIEQLMTMTSEGIDELRQYIRELKHSAPPEARLVDSIRRFATKFEGATGIQVDVVNECEELSTNERLNAEVFHMTAEALSNVHRHTRARNARVSLDLEENNLILSVENEVSAGTDPVPFNPVSICERAAALGGRTAVSWPGNRTIVRVEVPL